MVRVPQVRQKRVRERDETTRRGDGTSGERKRSVVRKNRREEEQGRVVAPGGRRREQGLSRHERGAQKVATCERRPGRPRGHRAESGGLLRAIGRDENVHERRHRRRGIRLRVSGHEIIIMICSSFS